MASLVCIYSKDNSLNSMLDENYLKKLWDDTPSQGNAGIADRIWRSIENVIGRRRRRRTLTFALMSAMSAAAVLAAGVFLGMRMAGNGAHVPEHEFILMADNSCHTLPDGSSVWLGHGGSLRFPEVFSDSREVWLDGNASFEVIHEEDSRPFYVHLGDADIKVTGTGFTVRRTLPEEVSVTLHHGRVELVIPGCNPVIIRPRQEVTYNTITGEYSFSSFFRNITWQAGHYKIENADLKGLVQFIEWQYGTSLTIPDIKDDSHKFNGTIMHDEPLTAVLDKICYVLKMHYKQEGDSYSLYK